MNMNFENILLATMYLTNHIFCHARAIKPCIIKRAPEKKEKAWATGAEVPAWDGQAR